MIGRRNCTAVVRIASARDASSLLHIVCISPHHAMPISAKLDHAAGKLGWFGLGLSCIHDANCPYLAFGWRSAEGKVEFQSSDLFAGVAHAEKYQSGNWIARRLVSRFLAEIVAAVREAGSLDVHEIGCGEGHILGVLTAAGFRVRGCDISRESLAVATAEAERRHLKLPLTLKSVYDLDPVDDAADTVICCEVLEHLTDPDAAMARLVAVTRKDLIVSVPNEPIWHLLNMARGKYLTALGNTPGHYQHWSRRQFERWVRRYADIVSVRTPLPWTLVHCRPRL
jgi:2-polyprenyl-3-methyl-5-hydroxy-6-metoxy-1,4-benzoquinol methylase